MTLIEAIQKAKDSKLVGYTIPSNPRPVKIVLPAPKDEELFNEFKEDVLLILKTTTTELEQLNQENLCSKFGEIEFKIVALREGMGNVVLFDEIVLL